MSIFKLVCHVTVSAHTEVEAETLEEAKRIAERRYVEIGGETSGAYSDEVWVIEDADGEPTNIRHENE